MEQPGGLKFFFKDVTQILVAVNESHHNDDVLVLEENLFDLAIEYGAEDVNVLENHVLSSASH